MNDHRNVVRQLLDSLVCLAIAVTLFRTFEVEGYIISSGSMAPILLGYHKRVVCPVCSFSFAFGMSRETANSNDARARCPNCDQHSIKLASFPLNEGDQLLVHKDAFCFDPPRRWEVAVFHNPNKPEQAYVKRIVGLPRERVQIVNGDILIDGKIQRKGLREMRAVRIPVHDHDCQPQHNPSWQSRWRADDGWNAVGNGFQSRPPQPQVDGLNKTVSWVTYRHWVRENMNHETSVPLHRLPEEVVLPQYATTGLRYDVESAHLVCRGVLQPETRERLLQMSNDSVFKRALLELEQQSHIAPITDDYGYNRPISHPPVSVRDLMLSLRITIQKGDGQLLIRMINGSHVFDCIVDLRTRQARLHLDGQAEPVQKSRFAFDSSQLALLVEMSTFDRQVLLALENETVLQVPLNDSPNEAGQTRQRYSLKNPVQFGLHAIEARVDSLKLFRDIYYRGEQRMHGISEAYQLGNDEYFVLGDNSPLSVDSRSWSPAAIKTRMLLGKPFLVHLPSRQGKISIGNYVGHIRIPDVSRIRYIR